MPVNTPYITPQLNSTKFAAIEIMKQHQLMRPTSSRFGNFLSSDKPASEDKIRIENMKAKKGAAIHDAYKAQVK